MAHFNFVISQNTKWGHAGFCIDRHRMTSLLTCAWLISILWLVLGLQSKIKIFFYKKTLALCVCCLLKDDALQYHKGMEFSTKDRDNDIYAGSCAERWKGGWWFSRCYRAYMNGDFRKGSTSYGVWQGSKGKVYWLKSAEMKIRTYSAKTSK